MSEFTADQRAAAAREVQLANQRLRGIRRNGGRTGATDKATFGWQFSVDRYLGELANGGERQLVGLLVEEADLAERLRTSPAERPELKTRLAAVRRAIRHNLEA